MTYIESLHTSGADLLQEASQWPGLIRDWASNLEQEDIVSLSLIALCFFLVITTLVFFEVKNCFLRRRPKELVEVVSYCQRISKEEYLRQSVDFTQQSIRELTATPHFQKMLEDKGAKEVTWNWQMRSDRDPYERSQELEYLETVEASSHPETSTEVAPSESSDKPSFKLLDFISKKAQSISENLTTFNNCLIQPTDFPLESEFSASAEPDGLAASSAEETLLQACNNTNPNSVLFEPVKNQ